MWRSTPKIYHGLIDTIPISLVKQLVYFFLEMIKRFRFYLIHTATTPIFTKIPAVLPIHSVIGQTGQLESPYCWIREGTEELPPLPMPIP